VRLSVEGADVEMSKVVLHWKSRPDDTGWMVGTVKTGGQTAAISLPDIKGLFPRFHDASRHASVAESRKGKTRFVSPS
jgi:hypothetical protein